MSAVSAEKRVPLITMPNYVRAASVCGFSLGDVLDAIGLSIDLDKVETASLPYDDFERLMTECVKRSSDRHFPLALGETFSFEYLPELATFISTSATIRECARSLSWLPILINPLLRIEMIEKRGQLSLRLTSEGMGSDQIFSWYAESSLTAVLRIARSLLNGRADFSDVSFKFPTPDYYRQAQGVFGLPVVYGANECALHADASVLDFPLPGSFALLHRQAEQRVVEKISMRSGEIAAAIRLGELMEGKPELLGEGIESAAAALAMHPRTLQRRLSEEKTNYCDVQATVRFKLAKGLLADEQLDLEAISGRLGFADRRSFTRAFTRWSGVTPSQFRKNLSR